MSRDAFFLIYNHSNLTMIIIIIIIIEQHLVFIRL